MVQTHTFHKESYFLLMKPILLGTSKYINLQWTFMDLFMPGLFCHPVAWP